MEKICVKEGKSVILAEKLGILYVKSINSYRDNYGLERGCTTRCTVVAIAIIFLYLCACY